MAALRTSGFLSITDLAQDLGVTDMTVRRDLRRLEETGEVRVVRGGVSLSHGTLRTSDFLNRAGLGADAKRRIAARACQLVRPGDTIAVDSGTSAYEVAANLPESFGGSVITHSVPVIQLMLHRPKTRLIGLGGELVSPSQAFAGPLTVEVVSKLKVRLYFMGAVAIDERGLYVHTDIERPVKQALMNAAQTVVLLADSQKFQQTAPMRLCPLDRLTTVVTERIPPEPIAAALKAANVNVIIADETATPSLR